MNLRIFGMAAAVALQAGCAQDYMGDPVTEDIFTSSPGGGSGAPLDATGAGAVTTAPVDPVPAVPGYDPALAMVEEQPGSGGLLEREPDTCRAGNYSHLQGQNASAVQSAGITRAYRVIRPDDIVTQEYNPMRVNFYTDNSGQIGRISCG